MVEIRTIRLFSNGDIYQNLATELNISYEAARMMLLGILYGRMPHNLRIIVDETEVTR